MNFNFFRYIDLLNNEFEKEIWLWRYNNFYYSYFLL